MLGLAWLALGVNPAYGDDAAAARKAFKKGSRAKDWKDRVVAYRAMAACDDAGGVNTVLAAVVKEKAPIVTLAAIGVLGGYASEDAKNRVVEQLQKASGRKAVILLMALAQQEGSAGTGLLSELLRGPDAQRAALAALALGAKRQEYSVADLRAALAHEEWHVVAAAARGLEAMVLPRGAKPGEAKAKPPAWFPKREVLQSLAASLHKARGAERGDIIQALETISGKGYGWNPAAWDLVAQGKKPDRKVLRERVHPPYMFGIPIYGRRVSIVFDSNVHIDNAHPFKDRARLEAVCQVPGGRELPWFRINTIEEFSRAHVVRGIRDMPTEGHSFEVFKSALKPEDVFGKLVAANAGNKERAVAELSKLKHSNGNDVQRVMNQALDVSGKKDTVAWLKGPDVVLCVYSSDPALAKETDQEYIGSEIGFKAASRLVRINAVGVYHHAHGMLKLFAALSGGRYVTLER